jgi:hypothetical protein
LFHYPEVGNAYCFEYELLTQLLSCDQLWGDLLSYIPKLEIAVTLLEKTAFDLDASRPGTVIAWASGHHPQLEGPESWSTASVYHFAYTLDRLVAEAIRRALFQELRAVYPFAPSQSTPPPADDNVIAFAPKFLDTEFVAPGEQTPRSLRQTLAQRFVYPIARDAEQVRRGGQLSQDTPMSAIFFGPPGTSKTELAKIISDYLKWPLLSVDPSYLVQEGLDRVQAMANKLFSMLTLVEQVVVLLDEFDELGRSRVQNEDLLSRFITTAMLPKLAAINKERKIVFLLATNYVSGFDAAFSRTGRFDLLLQVMQPTLKSKLAYSEWSNVLNRALDILQGEEKKIAERRIADLTFLETKRLVRDLYDVAETGRVLSVVGVAWAACTLENPNDKWRERCKREGKEYIRLPPPSLGVGQDAAAGFSHPIRENGAASPSVAGSSC